MKGKKKQPPMPVPSLEILRMELAKEESRHELRKTVLHTAEILVVAAAVAVLLVTRLFMLLRIDGISMEPTLETEEVVILRQTKNVQKGDVLGFYYGGKLLLKRVIGSGGDYIEIDKEGSVYVNGEMLDEPYLRERNLGKCEIDFPYQVPEGMYYVLGDNREVSLDSRIKAIGCVQRSQIAGIVICRVLPLDRIGMMH